MYAVEIVEGKDRPKEKPAEKFATVVKNGSTTGLLLRLCESIFHIGMVVILDSGFYVLKALIELKKRGVFASALIKKRKYWPQHIKGEDIQCLNVTNGGTIIRWSDNPLHYRNDCMSTTLTSGQQVQSLIYQP